MPYRRSAKRSYKTTPKRSYKRSYKRSFKARKPLRALSTARRFSSKSFFKGRRVAFKARKAKTFTVTPETRLSIAAQMRAMKDKPHIPKAERESAAVAADMLEMSARASAVTTGRVVTIRGQPPGRAMPDRIRTKVTWYAEFGSTNVATDGFVNPIAGDFGLILTTIVGQQATQSTAMEGCIDFEELGEWYENYLVHGVLVEMEFAASGDTTTEAAMLIPPFCAGFIIAPGGAVPSSGPKYEDASSTPNFEYATNKRSTNQAVVTVKKFINIGDMFGPASLNGNYVTTASRIGPFASSAAWNNSTYFRPTLLAFVYPQICLIAAESGSAPFVTIEVVTRVKFTQYIECFNTTGFAIPWVPGKGKNTKSGANLSLNSDHTYIDYCRPTPSRSRRRRRRPSGPPRFLQHQRRGR